MPAEADMIAEIRSTPELQEACRNCRFWLSRDGEQGHCQRSTPTVVAMPAQGLGGPQIQAVAIFPPMMAEGWCGKFDFPTPADLERLERTGASAN